MKKKIYLLLLLFGALHLSCTKDVPLVSMGIDNVYVLPRMKAQGFFPEFVGEGYQWKLLSRNGKDSVLSNEKNYVFVAKDTGIYHLEFEILDKKNPYKHQIKMVVIEEQVRYSPYISKVFEYKPAPGQFINKIPKYEEGDTEKDMIRKAEESISGTNKVLVSLGSFGGYITFGFDHTVMNVKGEIDFKIDGNAFASAYNPNPNAAEGGSSEPGIVMVAFDKNQNGKPDQDEWYELAGSEYYKEETIKQYEVSYFAPDSTKPPTPDPKNSFLTDTSYIAWESNQGTRGFVYKNHFHNQSYYPLWISEQKMTFKGTKLKNNAVDEAGDGSYYVQYFYDYGYADNKPNEIDIGFNIEWAVDKNGKNIHLPGADFIRVYTGLLQYCGWLGETSTEIAGARDLHIDILPNQH